MKSNEIPSRAIVPQPFASGTGAAYSPISAVSVANAPSFPDGFPSSFSAPSSSGGNYITRGQMNAIGRLASQAEFFDAIGHLRTFDADFCTAIGGYPKGSILWEYSSGTIRAVESLVEDNTINFLTYGVDGTNWRYAYNPSVTNMFPSYSRKNAVSVLGPITGVPPAGEGYTPLTAWTPMPFDGFMDIVWAYTLSAGTGITIQLVVGPSSGIIPFEGDVLPTLTDPLDNTIDYVIKDIVVGNDGRWSSPLPVSKGSQMRLFCNIASGTTLSAFKLTDFIYLPANT